MTRFATLAAAALATAAAAAPPAAAQTDALPDAPLVGSTEGEALEKEKGPIDRYMDFLWGEIDRIGELDLYGVSSQLPKGYLGVKWDWTTIKAGSRFDADGNEGPAMEPIEFIGNDGQKDISIDLGLNGKGGGHTFQVSYGITDPLDWYVEIPFTYMNIQLSPTVAVIDEEGNKIDPALAAAAGYDPKAYDVETFLYDTMPRLGRPTPATGYKARWLLGDINTGFSWNYTRSKRFSASMVGRVFLPTGKVQNPNNALFYGTGPALDTSTGGWAMGMTHGLDLRVLKYEPWFFDMIVSTELTIAYAFQQRRPYPTNFVPPDPALARLDPATFPDLSHLEGDFDYTPGFSVDWIAGVQMQIAVLGLAFAYGTSFQQAPWLSGDPAFVSMVEGLELIGQQTLRSWQVGASLPLLPLLPASLGVSYRKAVSGNNAIVFDDYWQVTVQAYAPLFLLWE